MTNSPKDSKVLVTPIGDASYIYIDRLEKYQGNDVGYSITLKFSDEDTESLIDQLNDIFNNYKDAPENAKKKYTPGCLKLFKENEDGTRTFKFKTKATTVKGEPKVIALYDSKGKRVSKDVKLGSGSKVRVNCTAKPYHKSPTNYGVTLYLNSLQIVDLVEYQSGGNGFTEVAGYVA